MIDEPAPGATLSLLLDYYAARLSSSPASYGHGTDNPLDEAAYLLLFATGQSADPEMADFSIIPDAAQRKRIKGLFRQRLEALIPAAYLTHEAWFCGMPFYVDERVLIPRSPIAELIEYRFSPWLETYREDIFILDMCTGSGCIAIACACAFPEARVDAVDVSRDALDVAKHNIGTFNLEQRVRCLQSDLWQGLSDERYDLIVSNPPYVSQEVVRALPAEYAHEPELGLVAADQGLALVRRILHGAAQHLTERGVLIVEVGLSESALVSANPDVPFTWLEFERGGSGVFLLSAEELRQYFNAA